MGSISFGLLAAIAWGIHDLLIRYVGQTIGILKSMFLVLLFGALIQSILALILADSFQISSSGFNYSIASGLCFAAACIGHYNAFAKGPIKLVAPLIGTYSVAAFIIAAILGNSITVAQWIAVGLLVIGIAFVARADRRGSVEHASIPLPILLFYCALAIFGFAATFSFGQIASSTNDPIIAGLITRITTIMIIGFILFISLIRSNKNFTWPAKKELFIIMAMGALDALALGVVLAAGIFDRPEFASAASACFGLITVILAWLFLKERINKFQWAGIVAVFASIAYLSAS